VTTHELGIEDPSSPFLVAFIKFFLSYWQGELSKICKKIITTQKNFVYKHTVDSKNVHRNKKKEKGKFTSHQVNSN
jgi:hypothetical protein